MTLFICQKGNEWAIWSSFKTTLNGYVTTYSIWGQLPILFYTNIVHTCLLRVTKVTSSENSAETCWNVVLLTWGIFAEWYRIPLVRYGNSLWFLLSGRHLLFVLMHIKQINLMILEGNSVFSFYHQLSCILSLVDQ